MADFVMLLFILAFVRAGWSSGLVRRLLGLIFLAVSFVAGAYLRFPFGALVNAVLPHIPKLYAAMIGYTIASSAILVVLNLVSRPVMGWLPKPGVASRTD